MTSEDADMITQRLNDIVTRMDALLDHQGVSLDAFLERRKAEAGNRVRVYLSENPNQVLQAVKMYRDASGDGLKESSDFVKALVASAPDSEREAGQP
jgi:ribosomal protein L7/L12